MALVSIIIPAYNAERYLGEAIESCLAQTYSKIEIIVVDDGSTDSTRQIAQAYSQISYIYQDNSGPAKARNTGITHAKGQFLQFLDADDVLLPEKIASCLCVFEAYPDMDLVYTDYEWRSEDLQELAEGVKKPYINPPPDQILEQMLNTAATVFAPHCPLIKANLVKKWGGFDEALIGTEDWHFWAKLAAHGAKMRYLDEVLVWYRFTPGSLSKNEIKFMQMRLKAYEHLRSLNLPSTIDLEERIAGRYHALAMKLWEHEQKREARRAFQMAIKLHSKSRFIRSLLYCATFFLSHDVAIECVNQGLKIKRKSAYAHRTD